MSENTKEKKKRRKIAPEKTENNFDSEKTVNSAVKDSWSEDQKEKSYYYDDSYGYEVYDPETDEEED